MQVEFAFLADHAANEGGKLNAMGIGWHQVFAPKLPHRIPHFTVVARISAHVSEVGDKPVRISLIDADGGDVIRPVDGTLHVSRPPKGTETAANFVVNLEGATFREYGDYSLHMTIGGEERVRLPFTVTAPPQSDR